MTAGVRLTTGLPLIIPLEAVVTRVQMAMPGEPTDFASVLRLLVGESGVAGLYAGISAYIVSCMQPALQFSLFERMKSVALQSNASGPGASQSLSLIQSFVIGAVSKAIAATSVQVCALDVLHTHQFYLSTSSVHQ